ncbi:MAG TPA: PAS domain S-box protein [Anaerolineales bacterium]|jgi:PAS domain S-box-containing protein
MEIRLVQVLLIEDNPGDVLRVNALLSAQPGKEHFHVAQAGSLVEGLDLLAQNRPDVILLSLNLADGPALEGLEKLKARAGALPVIVLTRPESTDLAELAMSRGAQDYLVTTAMDSALLARAIRHAIERWQAAEKLVLSDAAFKAAFESAISGMALVSREGVLTSANAELCRLLGYTRPELEGKHIEDILHPLDVRFTSAMIKRILAGEANTFNFENRFLQKDGRVVWAQISGGLVRGSDGQARYYAMHVHDITEPLYAATRLRQTEEKYHSLFENIPDGVYRTTPGGVFLAANPALVRMLGFESEDKLRQVSVLDFYVDPRQREDFLNMTGAQGEVRDLELHLRTPDGRQLSVLNNARVFRDKDGGIEFIEGSLTDITARKQAQEALRESEVRYRTLIEQLPTVIYRTASDGSGAGLYISPQIESMLGITPQEWLSSPGFWKEQVHPDDRDRLLFEDSQARLNLQDFNREYRLVSKQGRVVWVEDHARLVRDEQGLPLYYQGLITDITERKQAEVTQRLLEEKFTKAFQSSPDAIIILRLEDGVFVDVNQGFTTQFGYATEEVLGRSPGAVGLWADLKERKNLLQALEGQTELNNIEISLRVKDGSVRSCLVSGRRIEINSEMCVILIARDITASKRAADELLESNRRLSDTLENIHLLAVILDGDGYITFCNDYLLRLTGWRRAEIMGADWFELFSSGPEARQEFDQFINNSAILSHLENTIRTRDGGRLRISWNNTLLRGGNGQPTGVACIGEDITRRAWAEAALRESEERYRNIYENATIGMYRTTPAGDILMANPAIIRMLGYDSFEDLSRHNLEAEPEVSNYHRSEFREQMDREGEVNGQEVSWQRKDGSIIFVRESARSICDRDGNTLYYEGTIEDISERKQAEAALQKQLERLNALRTIDETIIGSPDLKFILNVLLEQVTAQLKVDACVIMLFSEETRLLRFGASKGFRTQGLRQTTQRIGDTISGRVARERTSLYVADLNREATNPYLAAALSGEDFVTYLGVPLIAKGQVKGILEIYQRSFFKPNAEWSGTLDMMCGLAAISIENASLFEGLQRSNFDLEMAYDTTLEGWSRALDLRDRETEGHSKRVTALTVSMAQAYGFSDREIVQVRRGSLLHDIGKMGIPDAILLKPGTLTQAEWKIMRKHPVYAYELLSPIKYLQPALDIPYCHHERWNGSGYPRGLEGSQIPLAARIFAIVDVYDALTSNRPYRPAWSTDKTFNYLRTQSGVLFDSQMVELFFKLTLR